MPIDLTKAAPTAAPPQQLGQIANNQIGAQRSQLLAELLNGQAYQQRLPGSNMEGASRVLQAGLGAYHNYQQNQQEMAQRQALISALGGTEGIDPLEQALVASGDKSAINTVVQGRLAARTAASNKEAAAAAAAAQREFTAGQNKENWARQDARNTANNDRALEVAKINAASKEAAAKAKGSKLDNKTREGIVEVGNNYGKLTHFATSFTDDMGGWRVGGEQAASLGKSSLGELLNMAGVAGTMTPAQAAWWTDYQEQRNEKRHALFGSALTKQEAEQWQKADISPNMSPEQIRYNLERQATAATRAALILGRDQVKNGTDPERVAGLLQMPVEMLTGTDLPQYVSFNDWQAQKAAAAAAQGQQPGAAAPAAAPGAAPAPAAAPGAPVAPQQAQGAPANTATLPEVSIFNDAPPEMMQALQGGGTVKAPDGKMYKMGPDGKPMEIQ